jgi:hypothetical protein
MTPGRACPPQYGYSPAVFKRPADLRGETFYVVGGLYGNPAALDAIDRMAAAEGPATVVVFNGDYHWFDASPSWFSALQRRVDAHVPLRGNVETELAGQDLSAGCGCAYPPEVPDEDVDRSNRILEQLRTAAQASGTDLARIAAQPMHLVVQLDGTRVAIVHGDAWSLAGWRFSREALQDDDALADLWEAAGVDGFASSHTCLPALKLADAADGRERFIVNNGAAGMPNFSGTRCGLITRLSLLPVPRALVGNRVYGADVAGVYVDALAVRFDTAAWESEFLSRWPVGSPAHTSYWQRIRQGPAFTPDLALGRMRTAGACAGAI